MSKTQTQNNSVYLPKEKLWVNSKVFARLTEEDIKRKIPKSINEPGFSNVYGQLSKLSLQDPVSNLNWDYLYFKDSKIFSPAAASFELSRKATLGTNIKPSYCPHIEGTQAYRAFWKTELTRILYGYEPIVDGEPCGIRISGEFYFFLNYCILDKMSKVGDVFTGVRGFPDFLAMDYYYFKEIDARERPLTYNLPESFKKVGIVIAKSRRKGYSFKAAAGCVWITAFPKSQTSSPPNVIIASDTGKDAALCFKKAMVIVDWLSEYTPFGRQDPGNPKTNGGWKHIPMSMTEDSGAFTFGIQSTRNSATQKGRLSTISTVSLNSRPDKAAGQGADRVYFEEGGKTDNIKDAWEFTRPVLKPGAIIKGLGIIFGTGGAMIRDNGEKGNSYGFSELFNNPLSAELADYDNIYEYELTDKQSGFFVSEMWACFGAYVEVDGTKYEALDLNGNATFWVAELHINRERKIKKENGDKAQYDKYLTQYCKTPKEAFLTPEGNIFPVSDLFARDSVIRLARHGYEGLRVKGELVESSGHVHFKVDLDNALTPLDTLIVSSVDKEGCLLRYEAPMKLGGKIPEGAYIITVDPIGQNTSAGKSLTSIIVMKTPKFLMDFGPEKIVCVYRGRAKDSPQQFVHELLMKLSKYYNAQITFENDRDGGILQYFLRKGQVARLMGKPEMTISKYMPNSKTLLREYGHSMGSSRHKQIGEDLLLDWLLKRHPSKKVVDVNDEIIELEGLRNLDMLEDRALIEELIAYNRTGNFDVVMAMMGAIIQINEHWNEDFLENHTRTTGPGSVGNFWTSVYVSKYGSTNDKQQFRKQQYNDKHNRHTTSWGNHDV